MADLKYCIILKPGGFNVLPHPCTPVPVEMHVFHISSILPQSITLQEQKEECDTVTKSINIELPILVDIFHISEQT